VKRPYESPTVADADPLARTCFALASDATEFDCDDWIVGELDGKYVYLTGVTRESGAPADMAQAGSHLVPRQAGLAP
jgi:hypothetical protein